MTEDFGRYRTVRLIGSGGFGTVWLAHDDTLDAPVAIKVLADNWARDPSVRERFLNEAKVLRAADSDFVVRVHTIDQLPDGRPYFVMEHADRGTLEDRMRQQHASGAAWGAGEALAIVHNIAAGLAVVHGLGVVHRDLKPANVLFRTRPAHRRESGEEQLMLGDFGIAKRLESGGATIATGTPHYMAPEQALGRADVRSDIYSLSVVFYELLTGQLPFPYDSIGQVLQAQHARHFRSLGELRPDLPPALGAVVARGLDPDPDQRPQSIDQWLQWVYAAMEAGGGSAGGGAPAPFVAPEGATLAPHQLPALGAAAAGVAGVGAAAGYAQAGPPAGSSGGFPPAGSPGGFPPAGSSGGFPPSGPPPGPPPGPPGGSPAGFPPFGPPPGPPAGPPPGPPQAFGAAAPPPRRNKGGLVLASFALIAVLGAAVAGVLILTGDDDPDGAAPTEVFLEPIAALGTDPFLNIVPASTGIGLPAAQQPAAPGIATGLAPPSADDLAGLLDDAAAAARRLLEGLEIPEGRLPGFQLPPISLPGSSPGGVVTIGGDQPGLYGGTNLLSVCDKSLLVDFLEANRDKALAWAATLGVDVEEIAAFVETLTDVILPVDTRVTNHGFVEGVANAIDTVLQAGTAVLVNAFGVPVVRCKCGNPLLPPRPLASGPITISGTPWDGFDLETTVVIVEQTIINVFVIDDVVSDAVFQRPPGTKPQTSTLVPGTEPTPTPTATPVPTELVTAEPTPTPSLSATGIPLGTGEVQVTLLWDGVADLDLHVRDPEAFEIFFSAPTSPSGGSLDRDDGSPCGTGGVKAENVFWPTSGAPPGNYEAFVRNFDGCGAGAQSFVLEVRVDGQLVQSISGALDTNVDSEIVAFSVG